MKTYFTLFILLVLQCGMAQVAISKASVDGSALLDFAENSNKGLILPQVQGDIAAIPGMLVYNADLKKVQFYNGNSWQDLSVKEGVVDLTETADLAETGSGIVIGDAVTAADGVLVLNQSGTALVLPKNQTPWINIKNPEPGTMTYDPENNVICIFNGLEWTFWGF
ncbi:MAG: hypothetical protein Q4G27_05235 [Flavobacteriaceae bacterium]|nr:hypothetical protein [Flavobacteriaceae bacterium]